MNRPKLTARRHKLRNKFRRDLCRPYRESESRASRLARWAAELMEGFEPAASSPLTNSIHHS